MALDGWIYSLQIESATLQLVPSEVVVAEDDVITTVGTDAFAFIGDIGSPRIINVLTGESLDVSDLPGQLWGSGAGLGDQMVVTTTVPFTYPDGESALRRLVAFNPTTGEVQWVWTAFIGDPPVGSMHQALIVTSIRQSPDRNRILVHTREPEGVGQMALMLDSTGNVITAWPPTGPLGQPLAASDNLSTPPYVGHNGGWFDNDSLLYDRRFEDLPVDPRLVLVDPITGNSRAITVEVTPEGSYLPVGDGTHLLLLEDHDLRLVDAVGNQPENFWPLAAVG